jgi:hypothetical protein
MPTRHAKMFWHKIVKALQVLNAAAAEGAQPHRKVATTC